MISNITARPSINFGRALTTEEEKEALSVEQKARELIGPRDKSILIVSSACLPQNPENNTGVGHLSSEESGRFFDLAKAYWGINVVEDLPPGQIDSRNGFYCNYASSALSLGDNQVNLKRLTTPDYGNILSTEEFDNVVKSNTSEKLHQHIQATQEQKEFLNKESIVHFENVVGAESPQDKAMRAAFSKFKESTVPKVVELKKQFQEYQSKNNDWLEPKAIFEVLKVKHGNNDYENWPDEVDKNLYNPDAASEVVQAQVTRKEELLGQHKDEIDFQKFKQFIAEKHLQEGRENLNKKDMKLFGDCLIGFSRDEVWANPKAFESGAKIGLPEWNLPALDYSTIKDENSASAKLLKRKVGLFAQRYDGIRFDVSWAYVAPIITPKGAKTYGAPRHQGSAVLDIIEKTIKEVKGDKFNAKDLIHEFDAGEEEFKPFDGNELIPPLKNRVKVLGSTYMSSDWGSNDAFLNNRKFGEDFFVIGPGNHDPISLRELAEADSSGNQELKNQKEAQIAPLAKILGLDEQTLKSNPIEFIKAKFAEPVAAKNRMIFYMDAFGRKERFDSQGKNGSINYRYKMPDSFESAYHKSLQSGHGFNMMDSLAKVFRAKKLDETHPEIYQSLVKYGNILAEEGPTTQKEANMMPKSKISEIKNKMSKTSKILIASTAVATLLGAAFVYSKKGRENNSVSVNNHN